LKKKLEDGVVTVSAEALREIVANTLKNFDYLELQGIWLNPEEGEVAQERLEVGLRVFVKYGYSLPEVAKEVSKEVKRNIQSSTGFKVKRVILQVEKFLFS
jgi:uncharacterized alkaline shock family protein YloU